MQLVDYVFTYLETALCFLGISLNLLLIHCVRKVNPKAIATYSFLLLNCAVSDMLTCLVTLFVEPRIITQQDNIYYISNGFCKYFGSQVCLIGYGVMVNMYGHLTVSQLASFVYRLFILHFECPTKKQMSLIVALICIPTVLSFYFGCIPVFIKYGNETFKEEIAHIHPEMDVHSLTTYGVPHATNENNIATMWVLLPIFPVTVIVFIIRHRILKLLSRQTILSEQSKKLHRNLLKALTLQALLPPLYILGISLFMADISLGLHHYLLEYGMYTLCSIIPIVSPLSPLYFVSPYRKYVLGLFFKTPEKVVPVQASFTASSGSTNQGVQPQTVSTGVQTMPQ